jgi:hypothetical protein
MEFGVGTGGRCSRRVSRDLIVGGKVPLRILLGCLADFCVVNLNYSIYLFKENVSCLVPKKYADCDVFKGCVCMTCIREVRIGHIGVRGIRWIDTIFRY